MSPARNGNLSFARFILDQPLGSLYNRLLSPGIESALVIKQEEIAELAGLSRQRTNEALRCLEEKGLLRVQRVGLTILDLDGLQNFKG
jgi:DNA-binding GntR family transcriptional regulator